MSCWHRIHFLHRHITSFPGELNLIPMALFCTCFRWPSPFTYTTQNKSRGQSCFAAVNSLFYFSIVSFTSSEQCHFLEKPRFIQKVGSSRIAFVTRHRHRHRHGSIDLLGRRWSWTTCWSTINHLLEPPWSKITVYHLKTLKFSCRTFFICCLLTPPSLFFFFFFFASDLNNDQHGWRHRSHPGWLHDSWFLWLWFSLSR